MKKLIDDIKKHFNFLQENFNFSDFEENWWREECNVSCRKESLNFNVFRTVYCNQFPEITINGKQIEKLEPNNKILKELEKIDENEDAYYEECANILKRNEQELK